MVAAGRSPRATPASVGSGLEELVAKIASRNCTILIHGETGAGKEVVARRIHDLSPRAGSAFVAVDCTGLRDELMESQLFGHERGSFTGADRSTIGFFRSADGGTLFLDEIGELSLGLQAKLLRAIQERRITPLGGVVAVDVDVRIICATHRDLWQMAEEGRFRSDLLYRLDVVRLQLPPLRERMSEVPELVKQFLAALSEEYDGERIGISDEAMRLLCGYPWPGNIRELRNAVEHAFVFATAGIIEPGHLPECVRSGGTRVQDPSAPVPTLADAERSLIAQALRHAKGNQARAARWLRIDRRRLARKIASYCLGQDEEVQK